MLSSLINIQGKETLKYLSDREFTDLIKCNSGIMSVYYGDFIEDKIYNHKIISEYNITLDSDKKIFISGIGFNDYEEEINEYFDMYINDIFDVYFVDEEFTTNIHINLFATGEYIDIRIEK